MLYGWNCFYAFLCHDGCKLTEGKKILWLYECARVSVCVCAYYIFPLPLSFLGVAQLLVFKSYNIAAAYILYVFWHTGILDGMVVGFYGLGLYNQGDISQRVSPKYSSDPLNGKCGLNYT